MPKQPMNDWQHALMTHGSWIRLGHSSYDAAAANQYVAAASLADKA